MSLSSSISSALNGIRTSQRAMDVVSENVSNIHTEGYSRKVYTQKTLVLNTGVSSGAVSNTDLRQVDMKMRDQLRKETGLLQESTVPIIWIWFKQKWDSRLQNIPFQIASPKFKRHLKV